MVSMTNAGASSISNTTGLPVLMFYGQMSGSTHAIPATNRKVSVNPEYFTHSSGQFTCQKAFTGKIYVLATSNMNGAGSSNVITYCRWRLYVNGSLYKSVTDNAIGRYNTYENVSFTENTVTYLQGYCYGNSKGGLGDFLYIVTL